MAAGVRYSSCDGSRRAERGRGAPPLGGPAGGRVLPGRVRPQFGHVPVPSAGREQGGHDRRRARRRRGGWLRVARALASMEPSREPGARPSRVRAHRRGEPARRIRLSQLRHLLRRGLPVAGDRASSVDVGGDRAVRDGGLRGAALLPPGGPGERHRLGDGHDPDMRSGRRGVGSRQRAARADGGGAAPRAGCGETSRDPRRDAGDIHPDGLTRAQDPHHDLPRPPGRPRSRADWGQAP